MEDWQSALAIYEALNDTEAVVRLSAAVAYLLSWMARLDEAMLAARRGLRHVGEEPSHEGCRLLISMAMVCDWTGEHEPAEKSFTQSVAMAEELKDPRLLGEVLFLQACHYLFFVKVQQQADVSKRAVELLRSVGDPWWLADTPNWHESALTQLGRQDELVEIWEELEPLAERVGHFGALRNVVGGRYHLEIIKADLSGVEKFATSCLEAELHAALKLTE